jgi:pSer/pThr/pTyr-binding forkhead associated (FHA) protein
VFVSVAFLVLPDGSRVELKGDVVLGRSWVASIFPNAPWLSHISEAHAVIRRKTDGWYIEDLGSQYGTYVNGRDIRDAGEVKLNPGDVISLGGVFTLVFQT